MIAVQVIGNREEKRAGCWGKVEGNKAAWLGEGLPAQVSSSSPNPTVLH